MHTTRPDPHHTTAWPHRSRRRKVIPACALVALALACAFAAPDIPGSAWGGIAQAEDAGTTITQPARTTQTGVTADDEAETSSHATDETEKEEVDGQMGEREGEERLKSAAGAQAQATSDGSASADAASDFDENGGTDTGTSPDEDSAQPESSEQTVETTQAPSVECQATDGGVSLAIRGTTAPMTLVVTLAPGVKPSPGVYASGEGLSSVLGKVDDAQRAVIELGLNSGESYVRLALAGHGEDGSVIESAILLDASDAQLARADALPASDPADAIMPLSEGQSAPFTTSGYYTNAKTPNQIAMIANAQTGEAAYCNDAMLHAPGDPAYGSTDPVWYERWYFPDDETQAADQGRNLLDFILFHGYPTDPTVGGMCSDLQDAQSATQWAIWYFTNTQLHPTWEASASAWSEGFWNAYNYLVDGAKSYDAICREQGASTQPEFGTCEVWTVSTSSLQNILTAHPNYGWIDLAKASSSPGLIDGQAYSIEGATFEVREEDGSVAATMVTDANGEATALVPVGTYEIVETVPPTGHLLDQTPRAVTVQGGPVHVEVTVTDTAIVTAAGSVTVVKRAGSKDGPALSGATFAISSVETGDVVATITTGSDGTASTQDDEIAPGDYILHETKWPDGTSPAADVTFSVTSERAHVELLVVNEYDTTVRVSKVDAETSSQLSGAHLQILDEESVVRDDWVSDGTPHAVRGLEPGSYVLREAEAPAGYAKANDVPFEVALTSATQTVEMLDERLRTPFSFTKTSAATGTPLSGATFSLYSPKSTLPQTIGQEQIGDDELWQLVSSRTTGSDGKADFGELDEGTYLLLEEVAPEGFQRPSGGWLVTCDGTDGIGVRCVGDVLPCAFHVGADGLSVENEPLFELPRAGGSLDALPLLAGVALAAAGCVLAAWLASRRA